MTNQNDERIPGGPTTDIQERTNHISTQIFEGKINIKNLINLYFLKIVNMLLNNVLHKRSCNKIYIIFL